MKRSREHGMITFDQALYELFLQGEISEENTLKYADSENEVRLMIKLGDSTQGTLGAEMGAAGLIDQYIE